MVRKTGILVLVILTIISISIATVTAAQVKSIAPDEKVSGK